MRPVAVVEKETESKYKLVYEAVRDTEWDQNPMVTLETNRGRLREGETVRLSEPPTGSGPQWHRAKLDDGRECYVRPDDFRAVTAE